jgi:hypothetical protein
VKFSVLAAALVMASAMPAVAEIPGNKVTIGVLTDMNAGNADATGQGSVIAARLAAEDAAAFLPGVTIDVIGADHQNNPNTASTIARQSRREHHCGRPVLLRRVGGQRGSPRRTPYDLRRVRLGHQ